MLNRILTGLLIVSGLALGWQSWRADRLGDALALEQQRLEAMTDNRDRWHERTMQALEQLRQEREQARLARQAVAELQTALEAVDAGYVEAEREIRRAPPTEDGPVAPVLRRALEVLP